jgi:hypothetical protein
MLFEEEFAVETYVCERKMLSLYCAGDLNQIL